MKKIDGNLFRVRKLWLLERATFCAATTVTLGEFINSTSSINKALLAGEEWVTRGANTHADVSNRRAGLLHIAASALDCCLRIFWMDFSLHVSERKFL